MWGNMGIREKDPTNTAELRQSKGDPAIPVTPVCEVSATNAAVTADTEQRHEQALQLATDSMRATVEDTEGGIQHCTCNGLWRTGQGRWTQRILSFRNHLLKIKTRYKLHAIPQNKILPNFKSMNYDQH